MRPLSHEEPEAAAEDRHTAEQISADGSAGVESSKIRTAVKGAASVAASGIGVWLHFSQATSSSTVQFVTAMVYLLSGVLLAGRTFVHIKDHYWQYEPPEDRLWTRWDKRFLSGLICLDAAVAGSLVGCGVWLIVSSSRGTEIALGFTFAVLIAASSHLTLRLTRKAGLPRGCDTINKCPAVKALRDNMRQWFAFPGVAKFDRLVWVRRTAPGQVSGLVIVFVLALSGSSVANLLVAPAHHLIRSAISYVRGSKHHGSAAAAVPARVGTGSTSSTPSVAAPPPSTSASASPTYEGLCGATVRPGENAPPQQSEALTEAWFAIGGIYAACGGPAQLVRGTSDVYYVTGYCGDQLRAVAVVGPNHPAEVLLDGWAPFAVAMADIGTLRGASHHEYLGSGDFQVIYTTQGGYVLVRERLSDGRGGIASVPRSCFDLKPARERPVTVPPGLADLWLRFDRLYQPTWPRRVQNPPGAAGTYYVFVSAGALHPVVAHGACTSPTNCSFWFEHTTWFSSTVNSHHVTAARVLAFGPHT